MNRRRFCIIGALALGALGVGAPDGFGASNGLGAGVRGEGEMRPSRPFRVTVIRCECYEDIQSLYLDDPEAGPCDVFSAGDVMEFRSGACCPASFCRRAWDVVIGCVNGARPCVDMRENVMPVSCPDGARPVIFKVELL